MKEDRVIHQPLNPQELILLFHGVGSHPDNLIPLADFIAGIKPDAVIVSVAAPDDCDLGGGLQWFSVKGVTEVNRHPRIMEAMPAFLSRIRRYQARFLIAPEQTILIGFSQGAIMSLEAVMSENQLASKVVSLSGRMAILPLLAPGVSRDVRFSFIHGTDDPVINIDDARRAAEHLRSLGFAVSMVSIPQGGHEINRETLTLLISEIA